MWKNSVLKIKTLKSQNLNFTLIAIKFYNMVLGFIDIFGPSTQNWVLDRT